MYKVDFSLNDFNFRVLFNNKEDYMMYEEVIKNSVINMEHKSVNNNLITINYVNDKLLYNEILKELIFYEREIISSFVNEYYDKYNDTFVSSENRYLISNKDNSNFNIVCKRNIIEW